MKTAALGLLLVLVGCGDDLSGPGDAVPGQAGGPIPVASVVSVAGAWSYAWEASDTLTLHGTMVLSQDGTSVSGPIGWPVDYPLPELQDKWTWAVSGSLDGASLPLYAPPPLSAWDDPWWFDCAVGDTVMVCQEWAGARVKKGTFTATR